jgi:hypothetical protein
VYCVSTHIIAPKMFWLFSFSGECLVCLEGTTCPTMGMNATLPCPSGHYCLNGTYNDGVPCPIGQYNIFSQKNNLVKVETIIPIQHYFVYCVSTHIIAPKMFWQAWLSITEGNKFNQNQLKWPWKRVCIIQQWTAYTTKYVNTKCLIRNWFI